MIRFFVPEDRVTLADREDISSEESEQFPDHEAPRDLAGVMAYTADGPLPAEHWEFPGGPKQTLTFNVGRMGRPPQSVTMVRAADGRWVEL